MFFISPLLIGICLSSGFIAASMLVLKMVGVEGHSVPLWSVIQKNGDSILEPFVDNVRELIKYVDKNFFYIILHKVLLRIYYVLVVIQMKLNARLFKIRNMIKGTYHVESRGRASHFLHNITEFKNTTKRK